MPCPSPGRLGTRGQMRPQPSSVHGTGGTGRGAHSKFLPKTRSHRTTPSLAPLSSLCTRVDPDACVPPTPPWGSSPWHGAFGRCGWPQERGKEEEFVPAVGAGLCWPHIPAGREGRAGGGLGREGGGSATALRAPKSQRSVQGRRAPGRASPRPGVESLAESHRADDSGGQEVSHPGTGQVRGPGPPATPRTPAWQRGWGGKGWEGALLGVGTKL